jgi:O-antigen ligase
MSAQVGRVDRFEWPMGLVAVLAIALPTLLAYNQSPSATFLNQAAAMAGWGAWLLLLAAALPRSATSPSRGLLALLVALGALLLAALAAPLWAGLPWALSLSSAGLIGAALLASWVAAATARAGRGPAVFTAFCTALAVAGTISSAIGIVQVFAPGWADGDWIAVSSIVGRAVGNLRQPNHLSSLLLWAIVAVLWLAESRALARPLALGLALLMMFALVLSASRTGALSTLVLALWGVLDKRLSRPVRMMLWVTPLLYLAFWAGLGEWARLSQHAFGGEGRFSAGGDPSSSRFGIWANTLELIAAHPWAGVGYGEFNFAWTLTPFPGRPVAFFDHTHNLPLQLAVELGLPLTTLVLALLLGALGVAVRAAIRSGDANKDRGSDFAAPAPLERAALVMVLMISLHSLLEYPLWYAYFLLPAVFAFGLCLAGPAAVPENLPSLEGGPGAGARGLALSALLLVVGSLFSVFDYHRVVVIFSPADDAGPLEQRIAAGQHSVFFAHHADYAAATTPEYPAQAVDAFRRAPHYLLDTRLMMAWANALHERGDEDRARYLAQRLREFRNPDAAEFFEPCEAPPQAGEALPFQCLAPAKVQDYRDFR